MMTTIEWNKICHQIIIYLQYISSIILTESHKSYFISTMMMSRLNLSAFLGLLCLTASSTTAFSPRISSTNNALASRFSTSLNVAIDTSDIKNGMTIELDGEPFKVLNFSIMKQARGAAKTTIKFKNLVRGTTIENTYRSGEKFQTAMIEKADHQYTYADGVSFFVAIVFVALLSSYSFSILSYE